MSMTVLQRLSLVMLSCIPLALLTSCSASGSLEPDTSPLPSASLPTPDSILPQLGDPVRDGGLDMVVTAARCDSEGCYVDLDAGNPTGSDIRVTIETARLMGHGPDRSPVAVMRADRPGLPFDGTPSTVVAAGEPSVAVRYRFEPGSSLGVIALDIDEDGKQVSVAL